MTSAIDSIKYSEESLARAPKILEDSAGWTNKYVAACDAVTNGIAVLNRGSTGPFELYLGRHLEKVAADLDQVFWDPSTFYNQPWNQTSNN